MITNNSARNRKSAVLCNLATSRIQPGRRWFRRHRAKPSHEINSARVEEPALPEDGAWSRPMGQKVVNGACGVAHTHSAISLRYD